MSDLVVTSGKFIPDDDDLENLLWLAPRCSFDKTTVLEAIKNPESAGQMILEMRDRIRAEGKKLTRALVDLYKLTAPEDRERATRIVQEIADSGLIELHREEAQNILRGVKGGFIKPDS
ncbi:DUF2379 family protein [Corallococcus sp. AS-1-12]|uniref:DUF2379 family protein n=1 Tax=Corallococcus sp. AS-1-12 TaxID=2874598 RepID=UPI001CBFB732|nr:DUF2379 family protein [Corallococcus sp. AS-1-12]MBZ4331796.1 DUF2379 family protein [Corallococcus sp. AS-1-12]